MIADATDAEIYPRGFGITALSSYSKQQGVIWVTVHSEPARGLFPARYWQPLPGQKVQCDLCPRQCRIGDEQHGLCFVRVNRGGQLFLTTHGLSSGFAIDPVEKKPLYHFLPGTPILSFGTAGCNLTCKFCQNWSISKARSMEPLGTKAMPQAIAEAAAETGCPSVAFTYNEPTIFLEYAVDAAEACHAHGIRTVAVTAGYISREPRIEFYRHMDAANVDLKGFTEEYYRKVCGAELQPVLETLEYLIAETSVWLELTTLLIPGENDSDAEVDRMTAWVADRLGPDVPLHFSAFHPDWRMQDKPPTSVATLSRARQIGLANGLRYVYTGNVYDPDGSTTFCHQCHAPLILRDRFRRPDIHLISGGRCSACGTACAGVYA